ncbi:glycosyltransferase family 10 [uncultured Gelidibacter sp.]|uniref:glycosyltransferase family 10 domain-containing protein n=1 Tax=uncultured Gelidibacter sp. TaxID=259318 RepID=UPI00260B25AA|nr:glycosyltransferase family 10 [uncultured Gelidibacter sp.]
MYLQLFNGLKSTKGHLHSHLKLYRTYNDQKSKFRNSNIRFYNFWDVGSIEDYWFYEFITHHKLNNQNRIVNFISVFGDRRIIRFLRKGKRIFFTGENLNIEDSLFPKHLKFEDHYGHQVDLALGFNYKEIMGANYMRFPLWLIYFVPPDSTLESLKRLIDKLNSTETRTNENRVRFAALISRHDFQGIRTEIIETLKDFETVSFPGKFKNNTFELKERYNDNKLEYLNNFKFNICPENSNTKGYVTEKLFHSIMAGCIPIYWGSNNLPEPDIINPEAVLFYDRDDNVKLINQVRELTESESVYEYFLRIPPFKDGAAEVIWGYLSELRSQLDQVINIKKRISGKI